MDSNRGRKLQSLPTAALLEPAPAVNPASHLPATQKKLEAIRKALADGSYDVSASALADKLIDFMIDSGLSSPK